MSDSAIFKRSFLVAAFSLALAACAGPTVPSGFQVTCEQSSDCPENQTCQSGCCVAAGEAPHCPAVQSDAGSAADASSPVDGGPNPGPDAGAPDAAGLDAGELDAGGLDGGGVDGGVSCASEGCPGGQYCAPTDSCAPCEVDEHCGASCAACSGTTPHCDGTQCVACVDDGQCPGGFCVANQCVECRSSPDCPAGDYCSGGVCQACIDDQHCGLTCASCSAPTSKCDGNACVNCLIDADCPASAGRCVANQCVACSGDGDCPGGEYCSASNTCRACNEDGHCGTSCAVCSGAAPKCYAGGCVGCLSPADCGAGTWFCVSNQCAGCLLDTDCVAGSWCDNRTCVPCTTDAHCGSACKACSGSAPACNGTDCVGCLQTADCGAGKFCVSSRCVECQTDGDCGAGASCCGNACVPNAKASLAAVRPPMAVVGASGLDLDLVGSGFSACAGVAFNGTLVQSTFIDSTHLKATVPANLLTSTGAFAVQVLNPNSPPSNPNSTSLGAPLTIPGGTFYPDAIALYDANTALVGSNRLRALQAVDLAGWTLSPTQIVTQNIPGPLAVWNDKVYALEYGNRAVEIISTPMTAPTFKSVSLTTGPVGFALDSAGGALYIAQSNRTYQALATASDTLGMKYSVPTNTDVCCSFVGIGYAALQNQLVLPFDSRGVAMVTPGSSALGPTVPLVQQKSNFGGIAIDQVRSHAYLGNMTSLIDVDLAAATSASINLNGAGWPAINSVGPIAAVIPQTTGYSLAVVDLATNQVAGYLGTGGSRTCASFGQQNLEGIALDPATNRAFATTSCSNVFEGFNLNLVFLNNPAPRISAISPTSVAAAGPNFTLQVTGSGFIPSSKVELVTAAGTTTLSVTNLTPTTISASVPASLIACGGNATVRVTNPAPGGGTATMSLPVTAPTPVATSVSPSYCSYLSSCAIAVYGSSFMPGCSSIVVVGTGTYATTGNAYGLSATIGTASTAGATTVYVTTPGAPAVSASLAFTR